MIRNLRNLNGDQKAGVCVALTGAVLLAVDLPVIGGFTLVFGICLILFHGRANA